MSNPITHAPNWPILEAKLRAHDWYYQNSDDHSVWKRGEKAWKDIERSLRQYAKIDNERAKTMFFKYAPAGHCTWPYGEDA